MQMTCTAWVEFPNAREDGREKIIDHIKTMTVIVWPSSTGRHLLGVSFITNLKKIYAQL